ncbi:MAG: response regulator [Kiritimatiellae bacterium]|jgi:excisionase family DNA binding protein|nr:response regulator [Kiritimatiellia bacterium]
MKNRLPEPVFISAPKAANLCGVSRNTVCCWIRDDKLPSFRTAGGKYLIRPHDLITFMKANQMFVHPSLEELAAQDQANQDPAANTSTSSHGKIAQEPAILVVDDDPTMRCLTIRTLEPLGLPILQAEDGYDALHQLTQNPLIALVILDLIMPGQDGEKTFIELRKAFPYLPVIVCTGQGIEEARNRFKDQKPDLILTKPYQPSHLINSAATFLADLGF